MFNICKMFWKFIDWGKINSMCLEIVLVLLISDTLVQLSRLRPLAVDPLVQTPGWSVLLGLRLFSVPVWSQGLYPINGNCNRGVGLLLQFFQNTEGTSLPESVPQSPAAGAYVTCRRKGHISAKCVRPGTFAVLICKTNNNLKLMRAFWNDVH